MFVPRRDGDRHPQLDLFEYLLATGAVSVAVYAAAYFTLGLYVPALIESAYFLLVGVSIACVRRRPAAFRWHLWLHIVGVFAVAFSVTQVMGGFHPSGAFVMWGMISPTSAMVFLPVPVALGVAAAFVALVVISAAGWAVPHAVWPLPEPLVQWFAAGNIVGSFILVFMALFYFMRMLAREKRSRETSQRVALRSQKLESLGTLAGGIAHDFNNILMAFLGNVTLARRLVAEDHPARTHLERAERALHQATSLTQQLLTFSRGGAPVRSTASIVETILDSSAFVLHGTNVRCEYAMAPDLWPVEADLGQLSQLVQNLVLNAEQAMPKGGTIRISAANLPDGSGVPGLAAARRYVRLDIRDEGIGIPEELRERIFEPFFSTRPDGTGLGLTTCYSIATNHDGFITVDSVVGKGSTFTVFLPASDKPVPKLVATPDQPQRGAGRILVMDDEPSVLEVLEEMLQVLGYQTVGAFDGDQAIERYCEEIAAGRRFHAVILDLTVRGGKGGIETAREIMTLDPTAYVVASTGYVDDKVLSEHRRHGFQDVLRKPYQMERLATVLAQARSQDL